MKIQSFASRLIPFFLIFTCFGLRAETTVVMLGTGVPAVNLHRAGQGILVVVDKSLYLFEAGPGALRNMDALKDQAFMPKVSSFSFGGETAYTLLDKVFITHLDSDHVLGLPELLLRPWTLGRENKVQVVGPKGTKSMVHHILKGYREDIDHRLYGSQPANPTGYRADVTEIDEEGMVYQDDKVIVSSFYVPHGDWDEGMSVGYRIETRDGKTIVLSGDTRQPESLEIYQGVDLLIHEVIGEATLSRMPPSWQYYMLDAHTSTSQLAEIAETVQPGMLVLNHVIADEVSEVQTEMGELYSGEFKIANDLDIYHW
ncbi:MBL fold metallo-hydrolase [Marinobacterium mangrovicola]|uniref:Ribonuclease BN (tRNA processing enzyme) n=1 Tax=Marinobacterium mangrovicola TaxID=1476959 RepID=A0A4R1G636_9GAMM|nr:MBL fold metallo-hydrolase [Marinobacterium mangrovicola]TCK02938.1 ribonuclease BN (tRNA processing enzyme) [Marinobacterium mangrovicola]